MEARTGDGVRRELILPAPIGAVWDALTTASRLSVWFDSKFEIDLRAGGTLSCVGRDGVIRRGVVEAVEPPSFLAFRWRAYTEAPEGIAFGDPSRVEFLLEETEAGTRLSVNETPLPVGHVGITSPPDKPTPPPELLRKPVGFLDVR